jgi:predicted methyltransferase
MMCGTGRMTDIWASFYAEAKGMIVAYTEADVFQYRHIHDPSVDFAQEVLGHTETMKLLKQLKKDPENIKNFIPNKTYEALNEYKRLIKTIDDAKV